MTFAEFIAKVDARTQGIIMFRVAEAQNYLQAKDYDPEYDDVTPLLFAEIGRLLFFSAFPEPDEPEPEAEPTYDPQKLAYYCSRCHAGRNFKPEPHGGGLHCSVCGARRHGVRGHIPKR